MTRHGNKTGDKSAGGRGEKKEDLFRNGEHTTLDRSGDVSKGNSQRVMETRNVQHPIVHWYESPVQTEARLAVILCRNYQEDKRTSRGWRVVEKGGSEGESEGSQSWRKVAELISGTSGKRSFPRIMRADPGELAFRKMLIASPALTLLSFPFIPILHPPIPLHLPSLSRRAINLRLRQWRRCITRPLRMRAWI